MKLRRLVPGVTVMFTLCLMLSGALWADSLTGTASTSSPAVFLIPTNAGDDLFLSVSSVPSGTLTELNLFDPLGDLVASESGNGSDHFSSVIFPPDNPYLALMSGIYTLEVVDPGSSAYNFSLQIEGNTAGTPCVSTNFHSCAISTPEPSSFALWLLPLIALAIFRSRRSRAPQWV